MKSTIDYFTNVDSYGNDLDPAQPMTCNDCGRPAFYDYADESYHHAVNPANGCWLIRPEDRDEDRNHPLNQRTA